MFYLIVLSARRRLNTCLPLLLAWLRPVPVHLWFRVVR